MGLQPTGTRHAKVTDAGVSLNYTTVLNIIFLALAVVVIARYFRKGGGIAMLRMMNTPMPAEHHQPHASSDETEVPHAP